MLKSNGLRTNFIYNVGFQILSIFLPLLTAPYITRNLGANQLGIFSKSQACANYFLLFAMLGVNNYGNRAIARIRDDKPILQKTFWEIYFFQLATSLFSFFLYFLFCIFVIKNDFLIYFIQALYVFSSVFDINWFCFGLEEFKIATIRSTIIKLSTAIAVFLLVKKESDLPIYAIIVSLSFVISNLSIWPLVFKTFSFFRPSWSGIKRHIKPNLILFWPVIAVSLYNILDKLMLGWMSNNEEVAYYEYAEKLVSIPSVLILSLDNVIMPRMSNLFANNKKNNDINRLMDCIMMFAMFFSSAASFGMAAISKRFVAWFYGAGFERCGLFTMLLSPVIIAKAWAGVLRTQFIIPDGKDSIYIFSLSVGAFIDVVLNFLLIPNLKGTGAIIGTLATECSVCAIQFFLCRKDVNIRRYLLNGFSFCLIGFFMFLIVSLLSDICSNYLITLFIQLIVGSIFYITLANIYMIRIINDPVIVNEEFRLLKIKTRL